MKTTITFQDLALLWEEDKQAYVKRSTLSIYSIHLHRHLIPAFGARTAISEAEVQAFVNRLLGAGMGQKTVRDILMVLQMVLRFAAKYYGWEQKPMDIRYPTLRSCNSLQVLSLPQQRRLMQFIEQNPSSCNLGIALCLNTGMRIGEICALTWGDVDLKAGLVHVTKTIQRIYLGRHRTEVILDSPKTVNSCRDIPISASMVALLRPLKKCAKPRHYVLTNQEKPTEPATYRAYFKRLLKQLGLPAIRFHGLRHSFATRCIECNCDYKTVSALLGHANINTTLNLYVHPGMAQKKKCVNKAFRRLM